MEEESQQAKMQRFMYACRGWPSIHLPHFLSLWISYSRVFAPGNEFCIRLCEQLLFAPEKQNSGVTDPQSGSEWTKQKEVLVKYVQASLLSPRAYDCRIVRVGSRRLTPLGLLPAGGMCWF